MGLILGLRLLPGEHDERPLHLAAVVDQAAGSAQVFQLAFREEIVAAVHRSNNLQHRAEKLYQACRSTKPKRHITLGDLGWVEDKLSSTRRLTSFIYLS